MEFQLTMLENRRPFCKIYTEYTMVHCKITQGLLHPRMLNFGLSIFIMSIRHKLPKYINVLTQ